MFYKLVLCSGVTALLHAAYATIEYRAHLKLHDLEFDQPPIEVLLEVLFGTVLCFYGGSHMGGDLLPIKSEMSAQNVEAIDFRPDYINFNHRGKCLPEAYAK